MGIPAVHLRHDEEPGQRKARERAGHFPGDVALQPDEFLVAAQLCQVVANRPVERAGQGLCQSRFIEQNLRIGGEGVVHYVGGQRLTIAVGYHPPLGQQNAGFAALPQGLLAVDLVQGDLNVEQFCHDGQQHGRKHEIDQQNSRTMLLKQPRHRVTDIRLFKTLFPFNQQPDIFAISCCIGSSSMVTCRSRLTFSSSSIRSCASSSCRAATSLWLKTHR